MTVVVFWPDAIPVRAAGATAIEAAWLREVAAPLCTLSPPLEEPPPQYSPDIDAVLCWHEVCPAVGLSLVVSRGAFADDQLGL